MPKRTHVDENDVHASRIYDKSFVNEVFVSCLLDEMDILPPSPLSYIDESNIRCDALGPDMPLQVLNGSKRRMIAKNHINNTPKTGFSLQEFRGQGLPAFQSLGEDHFSKLSEEIILHIFQFLPKSSLIKCAGVCQRWKSISYDKSLWKTFDFGKKYIKAGLLETVLDRGVFALRLAMSEIKDPIFHCKEYISGNRFSKLQYLDLSMATASAEAIANLLAVCYNLKKLSLESCTLNTDCCRSIAENETLEVLNMCMCKGLTAEGLKEIATMCSRLKEWNLAWTHLNSQCLKEFLPFLPNTLTRLNISGHLIALEDDALIAAVSRCPNLTELDVSDSHMLTGDAFMALIGHCKKLEHLHISRCFNIPARCNRYLKNMKHFKYLEIFRTLNDEALSQLRQHMPEIKINTHPFSTVARPTTGIRRTSIWGVRVRD